MNSRPPGYESEAKNLPTVVSLANVIQIPTFGCEKEYVTTPKHHSIFETEVAFMADWRLIIYFKTSKSNLTKSFVIHNWSEWFRIAQVS